MTYGDPEIGGRPPRYQNWNAGVQSALARTLTVGAAYAGSRGDFLGSPGSGRGLYANQLDPGFLVLGNLLTQPARPSSIAAAQAIVPGVALPYANFSGTIAQMLRPFPQYSGGHRRLRRPRVVQVSLAAAHRRETPIRQWADCELQLHVQPDRRQSCDADRLDVDQDWSVGVNDQPHVWNALVVYNVPFGAEGKPGSGNTLVRAIVKDWQVSGITQFRSGRPLGSIWAPAICRMPARATPISTRTSPATSASMGTTATATSSARPHRPTSTVPRFSRPRPSPTATRRGPSRRSAQPELLQPGPQRPPRFPHLSRSNSGSASTCSMSSTPSSSAGSRPTSPTPTSAGSVRN